MIDRRAAGSGPPADAQSGAPLEGTSVAPSRPSWGKEEEEAEADEVRWGRAGPGRAGPSRAEPMAGRPTMTLDIIQPFAGSNRTQRACDGRHSSGS